MVLAEKPSGLDSIGIAAISDMISAGVLFLGPGSSGITGVSDGWDAITMTSTRVPSARSIGRLNA